MTVAKSALMPTYARLPVTFTHGEGVYLWDETGKRYLDALSGIAVCGLGHSRREIADALAEQARTLVHTSNLYHIGVQEQLGQTLCELSGLDTVFFGNSGAEANEAAIKMARLYGHNKGISHPVIAVMTGAFHGRTLATITAGDSEKAKTGFSPLPEGFTRLPFGDHAAFAQLLADNPQVVAVLVEPIQGEGGIHVPPDDYLPGLRALCDQHDCLLMLDEIQSGMCRTGYWFAHQHAGIKPDVMTLAKALGNGVPIGACLAAGKAADVFGPGTHGSTFGGNPLACRAGLRVLELMAELKSADAAATQGAYLLSQLREKLQPLPGVRDIRGRGLMVGIELEIACGVLVSKALEKGLLINVTAGNVIRLLPPLVIVREEVDSMVQTLVELVSDFLEERDG